MPSPSSRKLVVRFNFWSDPAMEERFAREPDIALRTCDLQGPEDDAWSSLAEAHAYQIAAARDELPQQWFATAGLLERCPSLLCVSSIGAGYDTVDVAACTQAGVLVVNQSGGNSQSVAEQTIGMMLDVSRRISEGDRLLRRERGFTREDVMGRQVSGKVLGLVGIGHIGRIVAGLAPCLRHEGSRLRPLSDGGGDPPARRGIGDVGRLAGAVGFRVAALPA